MIYTNFIFFIIVIATFTLAPQSGPYNIDFPFNIYGIFFCFLAFWQVTKYMFSKIRNGLDNETINVSEAKHQYAVYLGRFSAVAVGVFALEIYLFDLKRLLFSTPGLGTSDLFTHGIGVLIFICHLMVVWFWAYKAMGDVLAIGASAEDFIWSNVKFNLAIIVPWIFFLATHNLMNLDQLPFYLQVYSFIGFLFLISILAPAIVVRLWDCKPLEDSPLRDDILTFCESQGIRFKEIFSWNALNRSLVTAGVIGLIYPLRYLMITPELMRMLNHDELMAVVSHEVGHVKRKHMYYYLMFFVGFIFMGIGGQLLVEYFFPGASYVVPGDKWSNILGVVAVLLLFVVYFRFIFGFYIRNFERQADLHCFHSGINPNHMITSFMKLGVAMGDDGNKKNWHHFNISQRIDFLRSCMENPDLILKHNLKVKRAVGAFLAAIVALNFLVLPPFGFENRISPQMLEKSVMLRLMETPRDYRLHALLGSVSYRLEKWNQTKNAYEASLQLKYNQPDVLNNLAWLYLTCPETTILNHQRALMLAQDAAKLREAPHIYDTLAEAFFQNAQYKEAYAAAKAALDRAGKNNSYYKEQLEKMKRFYLKSKSSIEI